MVRTFSLSFIAIGVAVVAALTALVIFLSRR